MCRMHSSEAKHGTDVPKRVADFTSPAVCLTKLLVKSHAIPSRNGNLFFAYISYGIERKSQGARAVTNGGVFLYRLYEHGACEGAREYLISQGVVFREFVFDGWPLPLIGAPLCPACFPVILVDGIRINGFRPKAIRAALDAQKSPGPVRTIYAQTIRGSMPPLATKAFPALCSASLPGSTSRSCRSRTPNFSKPS